MGRNSGTSLEDIMMEIPDPNDGRFEVVNDLDDELDDINLDLDEEKNENKEDKDDAKTDEQEKTEEGDAADNKDDENNDDKNASQESDFEAEALKQYRSNMAAIGGKFDDQGRLYFDRPQLTPIEEFEPEVAETVKINRIVGPLLVKTTIAEMIVENPAMKQYASEVQAMCDAVDPASLNPEMVKAYFYYVRGHKADIEIAQAIKGKNVNKKEVADKEIKTKIAASSESTGSRVVKQSKNAKIDPETERFAKSIKVDPQDLANQLAARKARRK